jgi:TPR repeat protein
MLHVAGFLLGVSIAVAVAWSWPRQWNTDPALKKELQSAGMLFADAKVEDALARLDATPLLQGSAEAAFARAAILSYTPFVDLNRPGVTPLLRGAAERGFPPAQILLGWALLLDRSCAYCREEATQWFERALRHGEDRDARFGLALSWAMGSNSDLVNSYINRLLANPVADDLRPMALAFRRLDLDPQTGAGLMKESAQLGWSEAQFQYAIRYLQLRNDEARLWLAMAAAQGHADAIEAADRISVPQTTRSEAEQRLLSMASDPATAFGRAAAWCDRQSIALSGIRRCRLRALEDHVSCRLPSSAWETMGITSLDETAIYGACRSARLATE